MTSLICEQCLLAGRPLSISSVWSRSACVRVALLSCKPANNTTPHTRWWSGSSRQYDESNACSSTAGKTRRLTPRLPDSVRRTGVRCSVVCGTRWSPFYYILHQQLPPVVFSAALGSNFIGSICCGFVVVRQNHNKSNQRSLSLSGVMIFTARCIQCKARSCYHMSSVRTSVRLPFCPSICDVGGSWQHRLKILETNCANNSPASSLFVTQRSSTYSQGNMEKFWGENVRSTCTYVHNVRSNWVNRESRDLRWRCGCLFTFVGASRGHLCDSTACILSDT